MTDYEIVLSRFKEAEIDLLDKNILIISRDVTINGEPTDGIKFSDDKCWVCIPTPTNKYCNFTDSFIFEPQCYKVIEEYETF